MRRNGIFVILIFILCGMAGIMLWYFVQKAEPSSDVLREQKTFAMGTVVSEKIYGGTEETLTDVEALIRKLDQEQLSWRVDDSLLARLNTEKTMRLTGDFASYIQAAFSLAEATNGAFDPTMRSLIELWGIEGSEPHVPAEQELAACIDEIGYEKVILTETDITLAENMGLDLGAVGKGIALDVLEDYFVEEKISGATVAVGGSVLTHGSKPEGQWHIAVQDPTKPDGTVMGILHITGTKFISTSGDYEKYFEENGVRYHHILDRCTGYPADSGLSSVTIVCDNGLISDGLSTACFVMGYEDSLAVLDRYRAEAVFVFADGSVAVTDGLMESFELLNTSFRLR